MADNASTRLDDLGPLYSEPLVELACAEGNSRIRAAIASQNTAYLQRWISELAAAMARDRSAEAFALGMTLRPEQLEPAAMAWIGKSRHTTEAGRSSYRLLALLFQHGAPAPVGYCALVLSWDRRRGGQGATDFGVDLPEAWVRPELRRQPSYVDALAAVVADAAGRALQSLDAGASMVGVARTPLRLLLHGPNRSGVAGKDFVDLVQRRLEGLAYELPLAHLVISSVARSPAPD